MNIIIVGCGKVGHKLAEKLSQEKEHNITVIDLKYNVVQDLINEYDIMGVCGSCSDIDTLNDAGIENADLLIAATGADELNLLTCFMAKKTGGCQTIARVRNPEYAKWLNVFKEDLGLAMIINPEDTAAREIARILRFPSVIKIDTFAKGRVEILKFKVAPESPVADIKIADMSNKFGGEVLVCGVERGENAYIPNGDFIIKSGDFVSIVCSPEESVEFFKKISVKTNRVKDTIIVGGGATAYYLAKRLIATGIRVKIIEQNPMRCDKLCEMLPSASIINADGTENRVLLEEGLSKAESFVALTNIDEENVLLSLFAKTKMTGKIVTKVNRIAYDEVLDGLDLDTVIYPKNITADYILRFVRAKHNSMGSNIETMHLILDGKAEALEFRVQENSPIANVPLEQLKLKDNTRIACINRGGKIITPHGKDTIEPKDTVIVVTTHRGSKDISDILI
ncbi:MAG: Trk system potassium transporter TrkA [Clostridia bacterium]|nr:Trk system potassium transporter TrkA [Clostridia bacterium]